MFPDHQYKAPSKTGSLFICLVSYLITLVFCVLILRHTDRGNPLVNAATLDLFATILIFAVSFTFNNSSLYDPYWSVAPFPILLYWSLSTGSDLLSLRQIVILVLVLLWGSRLTFNWIRRWKGLQDEDWRYANFRKKYTRSYWIVSFFGIHLLPTVVVFLACLSLYPAIVIKPASLDLFDLVAIGVTLCAILIETIADEQLRKFLLRPSGQSFLSSGLWKYSRHPNYFGEVLFWIGLFLFSCESGSFYGWTLPGPFGMVILFLFVSVPMIDKRMLQRKEGYESYMEKTSALVFWRVRN